MSSSSLKQRGKYGQTCSEAAVAVEYSDDDITGIWSRPSPPAVSVLAPSLWAGGPLLGPAVAAQRSACQDLRLCLNMPRFPVCSGCSLSLEAVLSFPLWPLLTWHQLKLSCQHDPAIGADGTSGCRMLAESSGSIAAVPSEFIIWHRQPRIFSSCVLITSAHLICRSSWCLC